MAMDLSANVRRFLKGGVMDGKIATKARNFMEMDHDGWTQAHFST